MRKALEESEKAISADHVSSIYGKNYTPQLSSLVQTVVKGVSNRVYTEFEQIVDRYNVDAKLQRLEQLLEEAKAASVAKAAEEAAALAKSSDKKRKGEATAMQAARPSVSSTQLLPDGVTPADVLKFQSHDLKLREVSKLEREIQSMEEFNRSALKDNEELRKMIENKVTNIEKQRQVLAKTAEGIF